eukprot:CAMPEP_0185769398 /NCGR_PEP_ID=MMETSP1174-20130828/53728_1 /TAXON_ID=35687 /ORGANISM="Dictyocha speculum, Strain CCMP1381" /LENGTH=82 /DNA_ID=CAMNT_0028454437 /DNA_START=235 /DNA_END=483 /DNA_ORIENTATION=-
MINANVEKQCAAKLLQAGERLQFGDIRSKGKALNRDIKRKLCTKKKTRMEEKLDAFRAKLDREDKNAPPTTVTKPNKLPGLE